MRENELNVKGIRKYTRIEGNKLIVTLVLSKDIITFTYDATTNELLGIEFNGEQISLQDKEKLTTIRSVLMINNIHYGINANTKKDKKRIEDRKRTNLESYYPKEDNEIIERTFFTDEGIVTIRFYKNTGQIISVTINGKILDYNNISKEKESTLEKKIR